MVKCSRFRLRYTLSSSGGVLEVVLLSTIIFTVYFWLPVMLGCKPCPPATDSITCKDDAIASHASIWLVGSHCPLYQYSPMATLFQSGQEVRLSSVESNQY